MKYIKNLNESIVNEKVKGWNDVAKVMDKALKKAKVPLSYAKDYVKSLERMANRDAKQFFADYGDFDESDFIEDVEYNMANESAVNEKKGGFVAIYRVMGQDFKFGPLKTDDKKSIIAMLSKAIQGGFRLMDVVPADQVKESINESASSEEKRIATRAMRSIAKYMNVDMERAAQYLLNAANDVQRDIEKGKIK